MKNWKKKFHHRSVHFLFSLAPERKSEFTLVPPSARRLSPTSLLQRWNQEATVETAAGSSSLSSSLNRDKRQRGDRNPLLPPRGRFFNQFSLFFPSILNLRLLCKNNLCPGLSVMPVCLLLVSGALCSLIVSECRQRPKLGSNSGRREQIPAHFCSSLDKQRRTALGFKVAESADRHTSAGR